MNEQRKQFDGTQKSLKDNQLVIMDEDLENENIENLEDKQDHNLSDPVEEESDIFNYGSTKLSKESSSDGPQYRYIDGERYVHEDWLYKNLPINNRLRDVDYNNQGAKSDGRSNKRHHQTYNYAPPGDEQVKMHQMASSDVQRRRSEPVQGMHWQQTDTTSSHKTQDLTDSMIEDLFLYRHHRPKPVLYENTDHHRHTDWMDGRRPTTSSYGHHHPGFMDHEHSPFNSAIHSPYRYPINQRLDYRLNAMPYRGRIPTSLRHYEPPYTPMSQFYGDDSSLIADGDDSSLYLEGDFAPNNTVETADNSLWDVSRAETGHSGIPNMANRYAMPRNTYSDNYSTQQTSRAHTIDSTIGDISAITRASRLSLCHQIDDTDISQDIVTPQHSTPEKEKRPTLNERKSEQNISPDHHSAKTPPTVTRRTKHMDICLDERPDPVGKADDSFPKRSSSSNSHSESQEYNSCGSKDSQSSWGDSLPYRKHTSRSREHKKTHQRSGHYHGSSSRYRQSEKADAQHRHRHYSDSGNHSGNHSGSGGEYYSVEQHLKDYRNSAHKRSYNKSKGPSQGYDGGHDMARHKSHNSREHKARRSSNSNKIMINTSYPTEEFIPPTISKVKIYSSSRDSRSTMPIYESIRRRDVDKCPEASMLTQCNNESWNDREHHSILSNNSSLDCDFIYGYQDWEQSSSDPSSFQHGVHAPVNTPEPSELSWPMQPMGSLENNQHFPSVSSQNVCTTGQSVTPVNGHYYSKVPNISTVPEEEENFYMDLENIPEESDGNYEDVAQGKRPPLHTTIDSDCTAFMEGKGCISRPVTGHKNRGRKISIAKKLKKVGRQIHQMGHQKLQLKTLAHL